MKKVYLLSLIILVSCNEVKTTKTIVNELDKIDSLSLELDKNRANMQEAKKIFNNMRKDSRDYHYDDTTLILKETLEE